MERVSIWKQQKGLHPDISEKVVKRMTRVNGSQMVDLHLVLVEYSMNVVSKEVKRDSESPMNMVFVAINKIMRQTNIQLLYLCLHFYTNKYLASLFVSSLLHTSASFLISKLSPPLIVSKPLSSYILIAVSQTKYLLQYNSY